MTIRDLGSIRADKREELYSFVQGEILTEINNAVPYILGTHDVDENINLVLKIDDSWEVQTSSVILYSNRGFGEVPSMEKIQKAAVKIQFVFELNDHQWAWPELVKCVVSVDNNELNFEDLYKSAGEIFESSLFTELMNEGLNNGTSVSADHEKEVLDTALDALRSKISQALEVMGFSTLKSSLLAEKCVSVDPDLGIDELIERCSAGIYG